MIFELSIIMAIGGRIQLLGVAWVIQVPTIICSVHIQPFPLQLIKLSSSYLLFSIVIQLVILNVFVKGYIVIDVIWALVVGLNGFHVILNIELWDVF